MKKKLIVFAVFLLVTAVYFVFYHKSTVTIAPANADIIILVDAKKLTRQYVYSLVTHPSEWFGSGNEDENSISIRKSGLQIPDFFHIFHLKNSGFSEWYSIFEFKDKQQFTKFLKQQKFTDLGNNIFRKGKFYVKIFDKNCIVGTSDKGFQSIDYQLLPSSKINIFDTDNIEALGCIWTFSENNYQNNLSINLNDDHIEIKSNSDSYDPAPVISKLQLAKSFLETELDYKNVQNFASFFDKTFSDSLQINHLKATVNLEEVNDTIITYGYDDNFNEIEKKSFQKIIQPNYIIDFQTINPQKTELYFKNKKWINAQRQFTVIPFQPNRIENTKTGFEIRSTRNHIQMSPELNGNYIFVKNNPLLLSSFKTLSSREKKIFSDVDYIFYGNSDQDYYLKLQFKKDKLPLILRW